MDNIDNKDVQAGDSLPIYLASVAVVIVLAIAGIAYLYHTLDLTGRAGVRADASKTLVQLVAVGIIGGFIAWVLSERSKEKERELARLQKKQEQYEARVQKAREREESLNEFRRQAIDRLVKGTNVLRRAPLYIESHRSKKTYGEQMREILDTYLDITLLRHELDSFPTALPVEEVRKQIRIMEKYLFGLITEWKSKYSTLPLATEEAWPILETFEQLKDLREANDKSQFRVSYLHAYGQALQLIRGSIFTPPDSDNSP